MDVCDCRSTFAFGNTFRTPASPIATTGRAIFAISEGFFFLKKPHLYRKQVAEDRCQAEKATRTGKKKFQKTKKKTPTRNHQTGLPDNDELIVIWHKEDFRHHKTENSHLKWKTQKKRHCHNDECIIPQKTAPAVLQHHQRCQSFCSHGSLYQNPTVAFRAWKWGV